MPVVMDADRIGRTLARIAHEIVERNKGVDDLALVGVRRRGVPIAKRLARAIKEITGHEVPTGALDITLYRDDLMRHAVGPQPTVRRTEIQFSIDNRKILLVDRGHRELPIKADFVGKNVPTSSKQSVQVRLQEVDGVDEVVIEEGS